MLILLRLSWTVDIVKRRDRDRMTERERHADRQTKERDSIYCRDQILWRLFMARLLHSFFNSTFVYFNIASPTPHVNNFFHLWRHLYQCGMTLLVLYLDLFKSFSLPSFVCVSVYLPISFSLTRSFHYGFAQSTVKLFTSFVVFIRDIKLLKYIEIYMSSYI